MFNVGNRVVVIPIQEIGIVSKLRADDLGEPLIDVILKDRTTHLCRECELRKIISSPAFYEHVDIPR